MSRKSALRLIIRGGGQESVETRLAKMAVGAKGILPGRGGGSGKMLEVELRLNPNSKALGNTIKRKICIFGQGSIEALLHWEQDV